MIKKRKSLWRRLKENKVAQGVSSVLLPVLFGVLILALWQGQVLHKIFNTDTNTLPLPSRICHIIIDNIPAFAQNALYTLLVAVIGLVIGSIIGEMGQRRSYNCRCIQRNSDCCCCSCNDKLDKGYKQRSEHKKYVCKNTCCYDCLYCKYEYQRF